MKDLLDQARSEVLNFTDSKFYSNVIEAAFWVVVALILTVILLGILRMILSRASQWTSRTPTRVDDWIVAVLNRTRGWFIFTWIAFVILRMTVNDPRIMGYARFPLVMLTVIQLGIWGMYATSIWRTTFLLKKGEGDKSAAAAVGLIQLVANFVILSSLFLFGLSNLGIDIAALVTGLGVGGIAVALAAQNVLGDLLASLSIVLDKPFVVDDFIIVGTEMGTVESIGLKTTRVRSLSGEQLIFSNKDLLESRVRNFKRMHERRAIQKFGVLYSTPPEVLQLIPGWIRTMVDSDPVLRYDRCHFVRFADSSLEYELVFWVKSPEYVVYADAQQKLLIEMMRKFQAHGVGFAFPTRTIQVETGALAAPSETKADRHS